MKELIEQTNITPKSEKAENRREFLTESICSLGSLIGGTVIASAGAYLLGTPRQTQQTEWADAGELSQIHPSTPQSLTFERNRVDGWKVRTEKASVWVVANKDGSLTAFSPLCTHLGCAYSWEPKEEKFACPCHGSFFSKTGEVITGPAERPLDRYEVKVEGSRIWLGPIEPQKKA
jgi:menaquinol-cytochrome c reductase iron-sulfur subunit